LEITFKKWNKEHQTLSFQFFINRSSILMLFVLFFHVVCKISNSNMWTSKHLAQAFCTELTLWKTIKHYFFHEQTLEVALFFYIQNYFGYVWFWWCAFWPQWAFLRTDALHMRIRSHMQVTGIPRFTLLIWRSKRKTSESKTA
jgi:hypothetical protein